jgi:hypothetical protein
MTRLVMSQALAVLLLFASIGWSAPTYYFAIRVVDEQTGRGVPLVELKTTNDVRHVTDSGGLIAFNEPGLMDGRTEVFFHVSSHGYEYPKDGFGYRGVRLKPAPGGEATVKIKRINIAERMYRITGGGIYRDTVLLGRKPPTSQPVIAGRVLGQDSVVTAVYRGKMYWFWGDTNQPSYPLGNFNTSGATSDLKFDPSVGPNLNYFVDPTTGFSRGMMPTTDPGPIWIGATMVLPDEKGRERMICHFTRIKPPFDRAEQGLAMFNDDKQVFERWQPIDLKVDVCPRGHATRHKVDGVEYFYFPNPYPNIRVKADLASVKDLSRYEAFTPLKQGATFDKTKPDLERDASGKLAYSWKRNTGMVSLADQLELEKANVLKPTDGWWQCNDIESGKRVVSHGGTVYFNPYRKKWVMIFLQSMGSSFLGEVWYSEADSPEGPWRACRKVVTHDNYSFYNVKHHPELDREGGRVIYFEGTYTTTFTDNKNPTPRYEYNQVMYRLDLADPRLKL